MKIVVLLSAGAHPVSSAPVLPRLEAQAMRIALALGETTGLHAGPSAAPAADALGHGLGLLTHLATREGADPIPALVAALKAETPDLVLAGRRGQGGEETGLAPYAVAAALGVTIVADAVALAPGAAPGALVVEQALPKGARRRLVVRLPALVTVHPGAPAPGAYAYGVARRGRVDTIWGVAGSAAEPTAIAVEERAYRPRPKLMRSAPSAGSAAERLAAATGGGPASSGANVLVQPTPDEAARAILEHLRRIGVLAPAGANKPEA
ncbi:MAG TPA: electron transfer flavoprotein subunit beta [Hansschlegelia sp.]